MTQSQADRNTREFLPINKVLTFAATINTVAGTGEAHVLSHGAVVAHGNDNGVVGDAKTLHLIDYLANPIVNFNDSFGPGTAVGGPE